MNNIKKQLIENWKRLGYYVFCEKLQTISSLESTFGRYKEARHIYFMLREDL